MPTTSVPRCGYATAALRPFSTPATVRNQRLQWRHSIGGSVGRALAVSGQYGDAESAHRVSQHRHGICKAARPNAAPVLMKSAKEPAAGTRPALCFQEQQACGYKASCGGAVMASGGIVRRRPFVGCPQLSSQRLSCRCCHAACRQPARHWAVLHGHLHRRPSVWCPQLSSQRLSCHCCHAACRQASRHWAEQPLLAFAGSLHKSSSAWLHAQLRRCCRSIRRNCTGIGIVGRLHIITFVTSHICN